MIGDFLNRLLSPAPEPLSDTDARLAIAALLVRVARSDGDYASVEIANIDRVLATRYTLGDAEADALRKEGEALRPRHLTLCVSPARSKNAWPMKSVWRSLKRCGKLRLPMGSGMQKRRIDPTGGKPAGHHRHRQRQSASKVG